MTGVLLLSTGCGKEQQLYLETAESAAENEAQDEKMQFDNQTDAACQSEAPEMLYVYVCGEVVHPAVYKVPAGARICEAIAMAGGLTEEAAVEAVNQAEPVTDGMMIRIPDVLEAENTAEEGADSASTMTDGRLDLNTATVQELMTLSGIGEAKAESIVAYREKTGGFSTIEDIMNVEGIKEGVYNRIKDSITVR